MPDFPHYYGPHGEGRRRAVIPYTGPDPGVARGDAVECQDLRGQWRAKTAAGPARYDHTATGRAPVRLTVPVTDPAAWLAGPDTAPVVDWPAENVRKTRPGPVHRHPPGGLKPPGLHPAGWGSWT